MRKVGIAGALVSVVLGATVEAAELSPREIYERAAPGVVMVMGHSDAGRKGSGGTGSIVQVDGLILTNAHVVIEEATGKPYPRLTVFLKPDRVTGDPKVDLAKGLSAKVLAYSNALDLAVLKLQNPPANLPVVALGESGLTHIGDHVVAIGHPEQGGLWTLTTGVISAEFENFNGVQGKHVFQTETGLNRGNSGSPLLDGQGRMVGVNTAIARVASDGMPITSISFALKSTVAANWLRDQGVKMPAIQSVNAPKPAPQTPATSLGPSPVASPPVVAPAPVPPAATPPAPTVLPAPAKPVPPPAATQPAHPYNLDKLVSERERAEGEMEDMLKEMRDRMRGR